MGDDDAAPDFVLRQRDCPVPFRHQRHRASPLLATSKVTGKATSMRTGMRTGKGTGKRTAKGTTLKLDATSITAAV